MNINPNSRIVDDSQFPVRKVKKTTAVTKNSLSYDMGHRFNLLLSCDHAAVTKSEIPPSVAKCMACYKEAGNTVVFK